MRGTKISDEQKEDVARLFGGGRIVQEIHQETGISTGALSGVINEKALQDKFLKKTHEVARYEIEHNVSPETLLLGTKIHSEVEELGLTLEDVTKHVFPFLTQA